MTVKSIFKILLGTIVSMVAISLIAEVYNVNTASFRLTQLSKMSVKQAAELFSQETYKQYEVGEDKVGGAVNMDGLYATDGNLYIDGNFYINNNPEDIYNSLYTSNNFKNWLNNNEAAKKGNWYNLKLINMALNTPNKLNVQYGQEGYDEAMTAKLYKEVMMTPSNLGIPYLDPDVLTSMFKWNLGQLMSNCNTEAIHIDDGGNYYILYNGFRVYADKAYISNIEYKTYNLTNSSDRSDFMKLTNIDPDKLGFKYDNNLEDTINSLEDERSRVCLVGISYNVPINYEGITPLKSILSYVWNNEVDGYNKNANSGNNYQYNENTSNLEGGGFDSGTDEEGVLPVPGDIIYYIIK